MHAQGDGWRVLRAADPPGFEVLMLLPGYQLHEVAITAWDEGGWVLLHLGGALQQPAGCVARSWQGPHCPTYSCADQKRGFETQERRCWPSKYWRRFRSRSLILLVITLSLESGGDSGSKNGSDSALVIGSAVPLCAHWGLHEAQPL